jgi:iron complex outermembrane recepter protein
LILWACCAFFVHSALAQAPPDPNDASLEDLMNIRVTSVDKKDQKLSQAGAAVYVITQEDIRRSGMNSIPELLRMVPGVDVAQIDANSWAISIRGFNYSFSNKVLVLIDGRSVYTPLFSGVYWDQQDVPLEDIERIEVIRGPGGTVWGANAVNGVINIITKHSKATQGGLVVAGTGSEQSADGLVQYGGTAGQDGAYRVFERYFRDDSTSLASGVHGDDGWHGSHGGFRSDWDLSPQDTLMVQGDFFGTSEGQTLTTLISNQLPGLYTLNDKVAVETEDVLSKWDHSFSNGSEASLQLYYDHVRRDGEGAVQLLDTGDLDFQYHFRIGDRQDVVAGGGYRLNDQGFKPGYTISFESGHRIDNLLSTFVQDEIRVTESLAFTVGSKFEHNSYTGFEYEPSGQLVWTPTKRQTIWASVSRAIRQPAWYEVAGELEIQTVPEAYGVFGLVELIGRPMKAEELLDFEGGYRADLTKRVSLDLSVFSSHYHDVETVEPDTPYFTMSPGPPHLILPYYWSNLAHADDYGAEFSASWNITNRWRISPGYSFLQMKIELDPGSSDILNAAVMGDSPKHEFQLRSNLNLPHHLEWDASAYYVSGLRTGSIPSYVRLDTRLGWHAGEFVEFSVGAQNLLSPQHLEFLDSLQLDSTYVQRSVFGKVTWRF